MAEYRIVIRRDTSANWIAANPVLNQGELAYEVDTRIVKVGDGVTDYINLPAVREAILEKQYRYDGVLAVNAGTVRLYMPKAMESYEADAYLITSSSSGPVTVDIRINDVVDSTITIPQGDTSAGVTSPTPLAEGAYVTIDITSAGTGAANLYITLSFVRA